MRTLHNKELVYVIQASDVRQDGGLREGYVVHIGRTSDGSHPVALACGADREPKYVYPFLPLVALGIPQPVCYRCKQRLMDVAIKGDDGELWVAPSSNTGQNSQSQGSE